MFSWLGWVAKDAEYFGSPNAVSSVPMFDRAAILLLEQNDNWKDVFAVYDASNCSKSRGQWPWFSSTLRMVALDRRFPMPGPCLEPLLESAELPSSATPKSTPRPQRLRLRSKVGWPKAPVPRVELDVSRWVGFQKISEDFPIFFPKLMVEGYPAAFKLFRFMVGRCWQQDHPRSSKIVWSSFLGRRVEYVERFLISGLWRSRPTKSMV